MSTNHSWAFLRLFFGLLILVSVFISLNFSQVSAYEENKPVPTTEADQLPPAQSEIFLCTEEYKPNSVLVEAKPTNEKLTAGAALHFTGKVENTNTFPITNGQVSVKIYQVTKSDNDQKNTRTNLVDSLIAVDNVTLPALATKPIEFNWQSLPTLAAGDYEVVFFFTTNQRFEHFGSPTIEGQDGSRANFTVEGGANQAVFFNRSSINLNNKKYEFGGELPIFEREEIVYVQAELVNPSLEEKTVEINWKTSNWGKVTPEGVPITDKQYVTLKPGAKYQVSYMPFHLGGAVTLVEGELKDGDSKSILQVQFTRANVEDARIIFPAIKDYPLRLNKEVEVFACVEAVGPTLVPDATLDLKVSDRKGNELFSTSGSVPAINESFGFRDNFISNKDSNAFTLKATLRSGDKILDVAEINYDCQVMDPDNCKREGKSLPERIPLIAVIVGLAGLLLLLRFYQGRKNHIIAE